MTYIKFESGPVTVEIVHDQTHWTATATDGFEDLVDPFQLPIKLSPEAVFTVAMHRYNGARIAANLDIDPALMGVTS